MLDSGSKSVVTFGTKGIQNDPLSKALVPRHSKESHAHESTSRALMLREAAGGKGELATSRKISGQDKLRLLAEDIISTAVSAPFRMEELLKMTESQLGVHLDEISNLKDPEFFCDDILATISSRIESIPDENGKRNPPLHDTAWVASVIGTRIHNVYTLAGSWRIIRDVLKDLQVKGIDDTKVREQLRDDEKLRAQYLVLYEAVTTLAHLGQQRAANCAAATPHYAPYFARKVKGSSGEDEMEFDQRGNNRRKIREAHKSYIDAIILELVLPYSQYPPHVLMSCLHNVVNECRKEEERFTQALWDAIGDLSVTIQVLELVESPLRGLDGDAWTQDTVHLSKEFTQFLAAQASSAQACTVVDSWKSSLGPPLTDTKKPYVLAQLWSNINKSYRQVSGLDIDTLWSLQKDLGRAPRWSIHYTPGLAGDEDPDPDCRALTLHKTAKKNDEQPTGNARKQITLAGEDDSDYAAIPELMSVSDSSSDGIPDSETDRDLSEGDYESDYDPEEDEWLQDMLQDALDAALDMDDLPEPANLTFDADEDKELDNPFKRMFSNLKDRVFSANPTLKANEQSRQPFKSRPRATPPSVAHPAETAKPKDLNILTFGPSSTDGIPLPPQGAPPRAKATRSEVRPIGRSTSAHLGSEEKPLPRVPPGSAAPPKSHKISIEEVEDEDNMDQSKKRKKKKKKNKKRQDTTVPSSTGPDPQSLFPSQSTPFKEMNLLPAKPPLSKSSVRAPSIQTLEANLSRTTLPLTPETSAQSARSYLQSENLMTEKAKVKSRPAFARSFFKSDKDNKRPQNGEEMDAKGFLGKMRKLHLPKRAGELFSRLINPADGKTHAKKPMKWDEFLKLMRLMGFSYDPSTAGSSVRFDPPDPKDPPITFHKPHPDPTLQRGHLREFGKRLKRTYGWNPEQFKQFVGEEDND